MKILFLAALLFSSPAFAQDINVLRNFQLPPIDHGYNGISLFFEESNPGVESKNVLANGCSFLVRSKGNFLLSARYKVAYEEETRPNNGDRRWWKHFTNRAPGSDMHVTCKSDQRISDEYVREVMASYVRVER